MAEIRVFQAVFLSFPLRRDGYTNRNWLNSANSLQRRIFVTIPWRLLSSEFAMVPASNRERVRFQADCCQKFRPSITSGISQIETYIMTAKRMKSGEVLK